MLCGFVVNALGLRDMSSFTVTGYCYSMEALILRVKQNADISVFARLVRAERASGPHDWKLYYFLGLKCYVIPFKGSFNYFYFLTLYICYLFYVHSCLAFLGALRQFHCPN